MLIRRSHAVKLHGSHHKGEPPHPAQPRHPAPLYRRVAGELPGGGRLETAAPRWAYSSQYYIVVLCQRGILGEYHDTVTPYLLISYVCTWRRNNLEEARKLGQHSSTARYISRQTSSPSSRLAVYETTSLPNWLRKHGVNVHFE